VREWVLALSTGGPKLSAARLRAPVAASGAASGGKSSETVAAKAQTPRRK
jgi:hypothetical protein